ncbi:MAG: single-stranded DNA-binding protein [Saccharofermentanales bacterium]
MNNIKFSGNIGKEPTLRYTPEGKAVLSFSVSLYTGGSRTEGYKPSRWIGVTAWEQLAEDMNATLTKGAKVTVSGMVKPPRNYTRDGAEVDAGLEVTASLIELGDMFRDAPEPGSIAEQAEQDSIPF